MLGLIRKNQTLVRYVLVGGVGVLFELAVIFVMIRVFTASDSLAVTASYWLGVIFSFLLQKFFAFENKDVRAKTVSYQTAAFAVLLGFNYLFTLVFVHFTAEFLGIYLSRMVALAITTGWNFFVYKLIIFRKPSHVS
ncbi:GtrA family protein [Rothia sp. CCM 9417]|uniref:GtrA family protein n=1 Tax=unclassified Rothia (in: high G+C Gram-positive bacteria) TaxID=2689056 RepID=UPI003AC3A70C